MLRRSTPWWNHRTVRSASSTTLQKRATGSYRWLQARQSGSFSKRTTIVADGLTLLLGLFSFIFIFPVANFAVGCALAVGVAALIGRWTPRHRWGYAPIGALLVASAGAAVYGSVDHVPEELPLIQVIRSPDGPAVLVDVDERIKSTTVTGTLAEVDGCLGLVDASMGDGTIVIVWRMGSKVTSAPFTLKADGESHVLGDTVSVPGAGLLTDYRDLEAYRPDMPESCYGQDLFL